MGFDTGLRSRSEREAKVDQINYTIREIIEGRRPLEPNDALWADADFRAAVARKLRGIEKLWKTEDKWNAAKELFGGCK